MKSALRFSLFSAGFFAALSAPAQNTTGAAPASANTTGDTSTALIGQVANAMPANPALPTLWLIGDSTVRNGSRGDGSNMNQWGWGAPLEYYFDLKKVNVVNRAFGGESSQSFYNGRWKNVVPLLKKGDVVIMQFGANDNGGNSLTGVGDDVRETTDRRSGQPLTIHSFGWYMKQYIAETREKGAIPIICSLTPRRRFLDDGHFRRDVATHVAWTAQVAKDTNTPYIDLYELIARKYEELGPEKSAELFAPTPAEYLHTGWYGAVVNAECVVSGLKSLKPDPLADDFSPRGQAIPAADLSKPAPQPKPASPNPPAITEPADASTTTLPAGTISTPNPSPAP